MSDEKHSVDRRYATVRTREIIRVRTGLSSTKESEERLSEWLKNETGVTWCVHYRPPKQGVLGTFHSVPCALVQSKIMARDRDGDLVLDVTFSNGMKLSTRHRSRILAYAFIAHNRLRLDN